MKLQKAYLKSIEFLNTSTTKVLQALTKKLLFGRDITDIFEDTLKRNPDFCKAHDYGFIIKVLKTPGASDRDRDKALKLLSKNFSGFSTDIDQRKRKIEEYLNQK